MGIDPDLQERLDDLRNGYGDPAPKTERNLGALRNERQRAWEIRTGYRRSTDEVPSA